MKRIITHDTNRDITDIILQSAEQYHIAPVDLLTGIIAESSLNEHATREASWPDVSYGLTQPIVAYLAIPGMVTVPSRPGLNADTAENRARAQVYCYDAANIIPYTAVRYQMLLKAWFNDPIEAWCRWNWPAMEGKSNPNRARYLEGQRLAREYFTDTRPIEATPVYDLRGKLSVLARPGYYYETRSLGDILGAVVHYTAGPASQTPEQIASYQISEAATPQTGTGLPFPGIAYTYLITEDGNVHQCWDLTTETWHAGGTFITDQGTRLPGNKHLVGICFTGDGSPNPAQVRGIITAVARVLQATNARTFRVYGHKALAATACPGPMLPDWEQTVLNAARFLTRGDAPPPPPATAEAALAAYSVSHPEYGVIRADIPLQKLAGGTLAWTSATPRYPKGSALVYRDWLKSVAPVVWP